MVQKLFFYSFSASELANRLNDADCRTSLDGCEIINAQPVFVRIEDRSNRKLITDVFLHLLVYLNKPKHISILGSTGSIGTQALEVIAEQSEHFVVDLLACNRSADAIIEQAKNFKPRHVVLQCEEGYAKVKEALNGSETEIHCGDAINDLVALESTDVLLTALVGYAGMEPTIRAIQAGKDIALANKETLVVAGELVMRIAKEKGVKILPVDSEHSAIFQCLVGEESNPLEKIVLTASGGPFRGKKLDFLKSVTKEQALKHPNWEMGPKITIDSSTLMNKGLEVIEAKWLFDLAQDQIEVVVHPESIIHSIAQFEDGSMKAQMGLPDMKLPIQYALSYPQRLANKFPRFDFKNFNSLHFETPDIETFRNLGLAFAALDKGGNLPCILNAANEIAVQAFLEERIGFLEMSDLIEKTMNKVSFVAQPQLEEYRQTDRETRIKALELV